MAYVNKISYNRDIQNLIVESGDRYDVFEDINYVMFDHATDYMPELPVPYNNFISDDFSFKLNTNLNMSVIKTDKSVKIIVGEVI